MANDPSLAEPLFIRMARLFPSPLPLCLFLTLLVVGFQGYLQFENASKKAAREFKEAQKADPNAQEKASVELVREASAKVLHDGWLVDGVLNAKHLAFGFNICLIIVAGGALARAAWPRRFMDGIADWLGQSGYPNILAVFVVTWLALITGLINWGFSLIFCGMLAARINERFRQKAAQDADARFNYPLIAACAYMGLLVWNGGLSGSTPLLASQACLPKPAPLEKTVLSESNLVANGLMFGLPIFILFFVVPFFHGKFFTPPPPIEPVEPPPPEPEGWTSGVSSVLAVACTVLVAMLAFVAAGLAPWRGDGPIDAVGLTAIVLLALGILFAGNASNYQENLRKATGDVVPILVQFPFYAGIAGVLAMDNNQVVRDALIGTAKACVDLAGALPAWVPQFIDPKQAFLIRTFFQACILKLFIPSGGMQWEIEGRATIDDAIANNIGVDSAKIVLAIAYGHQVGNMLQPFWVLPIVTLTRLRVADILAFASFCAIPAAAVFLGCLLWL